MTQVAEKQILSKLDDIGTRVSKIETFIFQVFQEEDNWLYDPEVVKYLKKRFKQAEREYKEGKYLTEEEVFKNLGV